MAKQVVNCLLCLCAFLVLSGCSFRNNENLLHAPLPPVEYKSVVNIVSETLTREILYAPPEGGENRQAIQFYDLDTNGISEAVAFFRYPVEPVLRINFYGSDNGVYQLFDSIGFHAQSFESMDVCDLDRDGQKELLISYRLSGRKIIEIYSNRGEGYRCVYQTTGSYFETYEWSKDDALALVIIEMGAVSPQNNPKITWISYQNDTVEVMNSCYLSRGITQIERINAGQMADGVFCLYITSQYADEDELVFLVTDALVVDGTEVRNVFLQEDTKRSRVGARLSDPMEFNIDQDPYFVPEFPQPFGQSRGLYDWVHYDSQGQSFPAMRTYHNMDQGWYLELPMEVEATWSISERMVAFETIISFKLMDSNFTEDTILEICTTNAMLRNAVEPKTILWKHEKNTVFARVFGPLFSENTIGGYFHISQPDWLTRRLQ